MKINKVDGEFKLNIDEQMKFVINRFRWIDNNTFKIISTDGIERIIDIK